MFDDVQHTPELFSYIQVLVDEHDKPGQLILTGSHNFLPPESVSQSLAGRCAELNLLPPSLSELSGRPPISLARLGVSPPRKAAAPRFALQELLFSGLCENFVHRGERPQLRFWRDSGGHEIDIELDHGDRLVPVEVKSAQAVAGDFFDGIRYWREVSGQAEGPAALVNGGDGSFVRDGVTASPWFSL